MSACRSRSLVALLIQHAPTSVRQHLQLNSTTIGNNYSRAKAQIEQYLLSTRLWFPESGASEATPMEVDAVFKGGKGKDKGQSKGGDKDKGDKGKGKGTKGKDEGKGKDKGKKGKTTSRGIPRSVGFATATIMLRTAPGNKWPYSKWFKPLRVRVAPPRPTPKPTAGT